MCDALIYLHTRPTPIIHRDVKPANIKITSDGRVMLVDFGLSKLHRPNVSTLAGAKGWSSGFSPPEQYDLGHTDPRSDEYALAATIYALLSGMIPTDALERQLGYATLKPLDQLLPDISETIADAIARAMSLNPADRFDTVSEFRSALFVQHVSSSLVSAFIADNTVGIPTTPGGAIVVASLISVTNRLYYASKDHNLIGRLDRAAGETPDVDLSAEPEGNTVSRKHAWLNFVNGQWYLQPHTDHKNVVSVNESPVRSKEETKLLRNGDQIQIGAVRLRFQI